MEQPSISEVLSIPENIDSARMMHSMLGEQFMLYHRFLDDRTFIMRRGRAGKNESLPMHGLLTSEANGMAPGLENLEYIVGYRASEKESLEPAFKEMYEIFAGTASFMVVSFSPSTKEHVLEVKERVERLVSDKAVRLTRSTGSRGSSASSSDSLQTEIFYRSDERRVLLSLLEMLNDTYLSNGSSYKVCFVVDRSDSKMINYIKSKVLVFEEKAVRARSIGELFDVLGQAEGLPFSYGSAAEYINFSEKIRREAFLQTSYREPDRGIDMGRHLDGSLSRAGDTIRIDPITFNLGTIISGLPGTGKTATAMNVIWQLREGRFGRVSIISPTEEWSGLGEKLGMKVVRLYDGNTKINFFKLDSDIIIERFYENLAMLLASASNAGPYTNSLEKSLLAAFRRAYGAGMCPDPAAVYDEIERAVADQHGKRSAAGVAYTKHGENIMAALQNLRLLLMKPQFAYREGINFVELLESGVVFDLSQVSNNMKPLFYALILNQIYAFADSLDEGGNDLLRCIICLEEAQMVFGGEEQSAATIDLKQRIQDFRKKGIGLLLITHNITDINVGIRRLCQTKLYFRQSADVAKYAASDLAFSEENMEKVIDRLKSLPQGVMVFGHVVIENGMRMPHRPVFAMARAAPKSDSTFTRRIPEMQKHATTGIRLLDEKDAPRQGIPVELLYVGERIWTGITDAGGRISLEGLLEEKEYKLRVIGKKKRDTRAYTIIGGRESTVKDAQNAA